MTSNIKTDASIQPPDPDRLTADPIDPSLLNTDLETAAAAQPSSPQPEAMNPSATNPTADATTTSTKQNNNTTLRQEAMSLTIEETRLPLRKDVSMREFLSKMDDYAPVVTQTIPPPSIPTTLTITTRSPTP